MAHHVRGGQVPHDGLVRPGVRGWWRLRQTVMVVSTAVVGRMQSRRRCGVCVRVGGQQNSRVVRAGRPRGCGDAMGGVLGRPMRRLRLGRS